MTNVTTPSLSTEVREATASAHDQAENSPFMGDLLSGRLDRDAFVRLTGQLWFVYDALEAACRTHAGDPRLEPLLDERLQRLPALEDDLRVLMGENGRATLTPLDATTAYARHLSGCSPVELAAHHYTRYLGDLSGGQVIPTMLRRHYGVDEGVSFYTFEHIGKTKPYKDGYRARLDSLPLTPAEHRRFLDEAVTAFDLNTALFDGLAH